MQIIYKSLNSIHSASSRIRCINFLKNINKSHKVRQYNGSLKGDIFYIQQDSGLEMRKLALRLVNTNTPFVYDISDDFGVSGNAEGKIMFKMATAITTNTQQNKDYFQQFTDTPVYVIPDAIDYFNKPSSPIKINDKLNKIFTYGISQTIGPSLKFMSSVPDEYSRTYISEMKYKGNEKFQHIRWHLHSFPKHIKSFDACILAHNSDERGKRKSNNKLITCMSVGIPTIVSSTPSYESTIKETGFDFLICKQSEDLKGILEELKNKEIRQKISDTFIKYSWDKFSPQESSETLCELFEKLLNE